MSHHCCEHFISHIYLNYFKGIYDFIIFSSWKIVFNTDMIRKGKNFEIIDQIELFFKCKWILVLTKYLSHWIIFKRRLILNFVRQMFTVVCGFH